MPYFVFAICCIVFCKTYCYTGIPSLTSRATLIVSVINRATPVFSLQFYGDIMVSEDVQPHTVVSDAVKASSPDGSDIYFTIEDGDPLQQFDIDFETGLF